MCVTPCDDMSPDKNHRARLTPMFMVKQVAEFFWCGYRVYEVGTEIVEDDFFDN